MDLSTHPLNPTTGRRSRVFAASVHFERAGMSHGASLEPKGALATASADSSSLVLPEAQPRRRIRAGDISIELRRYSALRGVQVKVRESEILFVVPLRGGGEIVADTFSGALNFGEGALLAKPGVATIVWRTGAHAATLHIPRQKLQAFASRKTGTPLRIVGGETLVLSRATMELLRPGVVALLEEIQQHDADDAMVDAAAHRFVEAWIDVMTTGGLAAEAFAVARSVKAAMDHTAADTRSACDAETLARIAAVTTRTLRRSFLSCLGVSLSTYVQQTRLRMIRDLLATGRESRTIAELAQAAGFASPTGFTRAYCRMFDETPTRTRVCAVQDGVADV